jgi:8-oxo-dGTP pyrophosphatase MutT (NUDIX family)
VEWFLTDKKTSRLIVHTKNLKALKVHFFSLFRRVDAAGGLVFNQNGELLTIKRWGLWDLPKGKVEKNERKREAAQREVQEETGVIAADLGKKPLRTYHIYPRGQKVILKTTFWYEMVVKDAENITPQKEEDIEEVKWVEPDEIDDYFSGSYHSLRNLLKGYLDEKNS